MYDWIKLINFIIANLIILNRYQKYLIMIIKFLVSGHTYF